MKKLILLFLLSHSNLFAVEITGNAYIDNKLVYIEKHNATIEPNGIYKIIETSYLDTKGKEFAKIKSDFTYHHFIPNVVFDDYRFKYNEKIKVSEKLNNVLIEKNENNQTSSSTLELFPNSVLGQGFHNFIVTNFEKILKNSTEVNFVISARGDQYKFEIKLEKIEQNLVTIKVFPSNYLIRAFVSPIVLVYDKTDLSLVSFLGLSNLENEKRKSQEVFIKYTKGPKT
jgi:hypothetical protein